MSESTLKGKANAERIASVVEVVNHNAASVALVQEQLKAAALLLKQHEHQLQVLHQRMSLLEDSLLRPSLWGRLRWLLLGR